MLRLQKTYDLARALVAREADPNNISQLTDPPAIRVYERIRRQLSASVGVEGFRILASRALAAARLESPRLSSVHIMPNGGLSGLDPDAGSPSEATEAGTFLVASLLDLILTFVGESITLAILDELRQKSEIKTESAPTPNAADLWSDGPEVDAAFKGLIREIDQLQRVSDRIQTVANKFPGMQDGLTVVAGSIRNIATLLDVFTVIRGNAPDNGELAEEQKASPYVM